MNQYPQSSRNTLKRSSRRGHYDRETIYPILDAGFLCHVGFTIGEQPYVLPNAYGREGDTLYLHGAIGNRMLNQLEKGLTVCITVTHTDGIVLARSVFHHSFNYRSVVLFGTARRVAEADKERALHVVTEQILAGRWHEARTPTAQELKVTNVLAVDIEEASAKVRTGPPKDDDEDYALPIWAGELRLRTVAGEAIPDPMMSQKLSVPKSVRQAIQKK